MKNKLHYLFPLLLVVVLSGCFSKTTPTPTVVPVGNFAGKFVRIHLTQSTGKLDTSIANINLLLNSSYTFQVTGDTTKLHAGSFGSYAVSGNLIQFIDKTATSASLALSSKVHLNGVLQFAYDGTNLQMTASNDTLGYTYIFAKQ